MNSPINWGAYYRHRFIVIVNFVSAEWKKKKKNKPNSWRLHLRKSDVVQPPSVIPYGKAQKPKGERDRKGYGRRENTRSSFHAVHYPTKSKNLSDSDLSLFYAPKFFPDYQQ